MFPLCDDNLRNNKIHLNFSQNNLLKKSIRIICAGIRFQFQLAHGLTRSNKVIFQLPNKRINLYVKIQTIK